MGRSAMLRRLVVVMPRGGARNRSGPRPDPLSGRSERRGLSLSALPADGFDGDAPEFPLPGNDLASGSFRERELAIWAEAWRSPQAAAWALESWRWPIIGEYCRLKMQVEVDPQASAALVGQLHRYRDQLGLTPAGLKENGWAIASAEVAVKRDVETAVVRPVRRLRAVNGQ